MPVQLRWDQNDSRLMQPLQLLQMLQQSLHARLRLTVHSVGLRPDCNPLSGLCPTVTHLCSVAAVCGAAEADGAVVLAAKVCKGRDTRE
jgi:hypothetical protein